MLKKVFRLILVCLCLTLNVNECNAQWLKDRDGFLKVGLFHKKPHGLPSDVYAQKMSEALREVVQQLPRERKRIEFSLNLFIAHEAWIQATPQDALLKAVDAFKEAGADRVDINPGLTGWLDNDQRIVAKYDAAVERIRKYGMKLVLNPQYSPIKHKMSSFSEWQDKAMKLYTELARRYQPDIFVVSHEPSTMSARLGKKVTISDWVSFVRQAAKAVKQQSPKTRIGAGGLASEEDYFYSFVALPEVEVLTLDIYNLKDLKTYNKMIYAARERGKPVYIEETWRSPYFQPKPGMTADKASMQNIGNKEFEVLDSQWIRTMTAYAQAQGLEAITPIWMFTFFKYVDGQGNVDDPSYNRAMIEAIMKDERTSTFQTIQELVKENQRLPH